MAALWRAAVILAACCAAAPAQAVFGGTVHDAVTGQPLSRAVVRLIPFNGGRLQATTDADGVYRFNALASGVYRIETVHPEYDDAHTARLKENSAATAVLQLAAGESITDASIVLQPHAVITGRVADADGEPLRANVLALAERWQRGSRRYEAAGWGLPDSHGEYRMRIPAGRYILRATGRFGNAPLSERFAAEPGAQEMKVGTVFYPNALRMEGAATIELQPGQQMTGVDFKLPIVPCYHVRGVVAPLNASPSPGVSLLPQHAGSSLLYHSIRVEKDGSFDITAVEPGRYWLELLPGGPGSAKMQVEVSDRDVNSIRLDAMPRFDVRGVLRLEGGEEGPQGFFLASVDPGPFDFGDHAAVGPDGSFVAHVARQKYALLIPDDRFYVQSLHVGGRELSGSIVDLSNGPAGDLEIILARGTGEVHGNLHLPDEDGSVPDAIAVLVSADRPTGNTGAEIAALGQNGRFQFGSVGPGRYYVFAVQTFDMGLWQNADFVRAIAGQGIAVDVPKGGSAQAEVSLVTAETIRHTADGVGR
jgi:hypothetical protein